MNCADVVDENLPEGKRSGFPWQNFGGVKSWLQQIIHEANADLPDDRQLPKKFTDYSDQNLLDFPWWRFEHFDLISDTPVSELFPYFYAAFPNAKVVHTVRNATTWSGKRTVGLMKGVTYENFYYIPEKYRQLGIIKEH